MGATELKEAFHGVATASSLRPSARGGAVVEGAAVADSVGVPDLRRGGRGGRGAWPRGLRRLRAALCSRGVRDPCLAATTATAATDVRPPVCCRCRYRRSAAGDRTP